MNYHSVGGKLIHFVRATVVGNNCKVLQPAVCFSTKVSLNDLPFIRRACRGTLSTKVQTKSMKSPQLHTQSRTRIISSLKSMRIRGDALQTLMTPAESGTPLNNMLFHSEKTQSSGLLACCPGERQLPCDCCRQKKNDHFGSVWLSILKIFLSVRTEFLKIGSESSVSNHEMLETEQLDWIHLCLRLLQMCLGQTPGCCWVTAHHRR